jgi:hypothetical protein
VSIKGRRRWVRYDANGVPRRRVAVPLFWGLAYIALCIAAQSASAIYFVVARGFGWFDSTSGQQAPVLLAIFVGVAAFGLSRRKSGEG